jgi:uncharacterized protein YbaR (Trm112 family)
LHLLLTDRLTCPRCGPDFGLILLAHRLEDRVVLEGVLGCANCRDSFPIREGFGDLRAPPRGELGPGLAGRFGTEDAVRDEAARLVALLGIVGGPGTVALVGGPARAAQDVARSLPEMLIVAIDPDLRSWPERERVSRLVAAPGLPFFGSSLRGVAIDGRLGEDALAEAARVVAPRGRVVVVGSNEGTASGLEREGMCVVARDAETVVAARS